MWKYDRQTIQKKSPRRLPTDSIDSDPTERESTSINIDPELWREVRKTAIDMGISAKDFFEQVLKEKLAKVKSKKRVAITLPDATVIEELNNKSLEVYLEMTN